MISGVIAVLDCDQKSCQKVVERIESHSAMETGCLIDGRRLPVTIESANGQEAESLTRWISSIDGVSFVNVVCVHLEEATLAEATLVSKEIAESTD